MYSLSNLPEAIPVFPLASVLLLPRCALPLRIFEPRYIVMLDDTLKSTHRFIGMIQPRPDSEDEEELYSVGCAGRVTRFSESDDGRYSITLTGISRFRIQEIIAGFTPYLRAKVNWTEFECDFRVPQPDDSFQPVEFLELLAKFFEKRGIKADWKTLRSVEPTILVDIVAMQCQFGSEERQALLEAPTIAERRQALEALMYMSIVESKGETMQ